MNVSQNENGPNKNWYVDMRLSRESLWVFTKELYFYSLYSSRE